MLDLAGMRDSLWAFLDAVKPVSEITVARYNQNARRADKPTLGYRMAVLLDLGAQQSPPDLDGIAELATEHELNVELEYIGEQAMSRLDAIVNAFRTPANQETLRADGFAYIAREAVLDVSAVADSGFEERATCDLRLRLCDVVQIPVGCIETIAGQGTYETGIGQRIVDISGPPAP